MYHHIDLVPTSFYSLFTGVDNLTWDHATQDEAAFRSDRLDSYDVILMYNRSDSLTRESRQNLEKFLNSGKGFIVLHHALGSYNNWEWWWKEVVGGKYQMQENEEFPKSGFKQEEVINMVSQKEHFITKAVNDFTFNDEAYSDLWISEDVEILYRTDNPNSDGPTVWVSSFEPSRVVVVQPGHAPPAHLDLNYKNLILQSILWVSKK